MLQRTNIYLESETIQYYKKKASQQGISMAKELRNVLEKDKKQIKQNIFKLLLESAKKVKNIKAPKDVAKNHDHYLYAEPYEKRGSI